MRADGEITLEDFERMRAEYLSELDGVIKREESEVQLPVRLTERADGVVGTLALAREVTSLQASTERFRLFLKSLGQCLFQQGSILIEPPLVFKKIAALEPVFLSSWNEQADDVLDRRSIWWPTGTRLRTRCVNVTN